MAVKKIIALDVGTRRIGVALADTTVRIAVPFTAVEVNDGDEIRQINEIIVREEADLMVVGMPRNLSGEQTAQSKYTEDFAANFEDSVDEIRFQDESLTSIQAEKQLKSYGKPYSKGDIDMYAATIILQDYLEENFNG